MFHRKYYPGSQLTFLDKSVELKLVFNVKCSTRSFHPVNRKQLREKLNNHHLAKLRHVNKKVEL